MRIAYLVPAAGAPYWAERIGTRYAKRASERPLAPQADDYVRSGSIFFPARRLVALRRR